MNKANGKLRRLSIDEWSEVFCTERNTPFPSFADASQMLHLLDADTHTLLTLYGDDGSHMGVGGGRGKYIVYLQTPDEEFWNLVSAEGGHDVVQLNTGGQLGEFVARQVVDIAQAEHAIKYYFHHLGRDPALVWDPQ